MTTVPYKLEDEPQPTRLQNLVVHPMFPLLGAMLGPTALGWAWFIFNGHGMGSPTRRRELAWVLLGGVAGGYALWFSCLMGLRMIDPDTRDLLAPYLRIVLVVWKLLVSYRLTLLQSRVFELFEYYSGKPAKNGWLAVVGLLVINTQLVGRLPLELFVILLPLL